MKKPNRQTIRKLERFCNNLARRCKPSEGITGRQILSVLGPAIGHIERIDPNWDLPWIGQRSTDGIPRMDNEAVAKRIWYFLYPELFQPHIKEGKVLRFEYAREGTCNPVMARPPSYIKLPLDTRIYHDKLIMEYGGVRLQEPDMLESAEFEILDDDWEDY